MLNKVQLIGNLGDDPTIRFIPQGGQVTSISVATTRKWKDKTTGEKQEETEWHRVQFFGRLAEVAAEYLKKGSKVYLEGRIKTRKWQDQSGQDLYTTEIIANEMHMLDGKQGGGQQAAHNHGQQSNSMPSQYDEDPDVPF